jgi:hypothetical protein
MCIAGEDLSSALSCHCPTLSILFHSDTSLQRGLLEACVHVSGQRGRGQEAAESPRIDGFLDTMTELVSSASALRRHIMSTLRRSLSPRSYALLLIIQVSASDSTCMHTHIHTSMLLACDLVKNVVFKTRLKHLESGSDLLVRGWCHQSWPRALMTVSGPTYTCIAGPPSRSTIPASG